MPLHPKIAREQDIAVLARGLQRVNRTAGTQRTSNAGTWFIPDGTFDENGIPTGGGVVIGSQASDFDGIAHRNPDGTLKPLVDTSAIDDKLNSAQEDIDNLNQSLVQVNGTLVSVNQTLEDNRKTIAEAQEAANNALSTATSANETARQANENATQAQTAADKAQNAATQTASDLTELAGITGRVIFSDTAPTGSAQNSNNMWVDGNGRPHEWNGSQWVLVTDSRITSAAQAANEAHQTAVDAQSAADAARDQALNALNEAQTANGNAQNAQTTANGKNKIFTQSSEPSHSGLVPGDQWNVTNSSGQVTSNRVWNGSSFVEHKLYLSSLAVPSSVGTTLIQDNAITTGKVAANAINASKIAADAVTADKIASNAVTADSIASNAVGTNELAANAVTTAKLNVTEDMTVKLLAAHKIEADEIDLNTLNGVTINGMAINGGELSVGNTGNRIHIHNNADISNIDFMRNGSEIAKMYFIYEKSRNSTVFVISSGQEQITNRAYVNGAQPDPDAPNGWTISSNHNVRILPQHALDMFGETCSMQFTNAVNVSTGRMTLRTSGGKIYLGGNADTPINTLARCRANTYDNNANRYEFDMPTFRTVAGNTSLFASATGANGTRGIRVNTTGLYAICGQVNVNDVNGGSGEIDIRRTPKGARDWSSVMSTGFTVEPALFAVGWTSVAIPWQYVYLNSSDVVTLGFTNTWARKVGGHTMMNIRPVAL